MSALSPSYESKNRSLTLLFLAINVQRGNRIIVIDTFFATSFSELFRLKVSSKILKDAIILSLLLRVVCTNEIKFARDDRREKNSV
jgi:hypothetical protein